MDPQEKVEIIEQAIDDLDAVARSLRSMDDRYVDLYVTNHIGSMHDEPSTFGGMIARLRAHIDDLVNQEVEAEEAEDAQS